jgi:hypothetical protein
MALSAGLASPTTSSDSPVSSPESLPNGTSNSESSPSGKAQAGANGELNLRAGLIGLRLAIYNDCPGFR